MQERHKQLVQLHRLLERHFSVEELRTLCFDLWMEYDNLSGDGKGAKARELVSYLDRHQRVPELVQWGKKSRPELSWGDLRALEGGITDPLKPRAIFIDFVNRGAELDRIFLSTLRAQYWIVDAPAGYGKTDFLKELQRQYNLRNWVTGYVAISRDAVPRIQMLTKHLFAAVNAAGRYDGQLNVKTQGLRFATCLLCGDGAGPDFGGAAIFIDNIDVLSASTFEKLVEFIKGVYEGLEPTGFFARQNQARFFLAGRDARRRALGVGTLPFTELTLSPYTFLYVQETVRRYAWKVNVPLPDPYVADIAAHLMYLSGGHPGCIADILNELAQNRFTDAILFLQSQPQDVHRIGSVLNGLFAEYEPDIQRLIPIMEKLGIFRRFRAWLFQALIENGHIEWAGDWGDLEQALLSTYLLRRRNSFLQDSITQRLLAIRLRLDNHRTFERLCCEGIEIYRDRLSSSRNPEQLAVEYVYLRLQHAYYVERVWGEPLEDKLLGILQETIDILTQAWPDAPGIVVDFIDLLEDDWELEFLTNYFLGLQSFDGPCSYDHGSYKRILTAVRESQGLISRTA